MFTRPGIAQSDSASIEALGEPFCGSRLATIVGGELRWSRMSPSRDPCPCDSTRLYAECCGRWHAGAAAAAAADAISLMRSRYSAFVLRNEAYLLATWHPSTRPDSIPFNPNQKWLGLRIVDTRVTGDTSAEVEFIARSRASNAAAVRLHERSRFVREGGRWFYVDGDCKVRG